MNRKTILTWGLFLTLILPVFAQGDFAITPRGDTLKGKIKMSSYDNIDRLQISIDGKKVTYTPLQIKSFRKDNAFYQTTKFDNIFRFMKVVKSGYLSLLAFNLTNQSEWDGLYLEKRDGSGMEVPSLSFKKILSKYLSDCPGVQDRINLGDLVKKDIEQIVDLYNSCIQAKTDAVIKPKEVVISINEKTAAVKNFTKKVEAEDFLTKKDVIDILRDIQNKVSKNESIPNYIYEGLRSYLTDTPALVNEADELIVLLKK